MAENGAYYSTTRIVAQVAADGAAALSRFAVDALRGLTPDNVL